MRINHAARALALALIVSFSLFAAKPAPAQSNGGLIGPGQVFGNFGAGKSAGAPVNPTPLLTSCPSWLTPGQFVAIGSAIASAAIDIWDGSQCVQLGTLSGHAFIHSGTVNSLGNVISDSSIAIAGTGSGPYTGTVTIKCAVATPSQPGCVEPDGTIITDTGGAITVAKGSASQFGVVEVDNATLTASAGVISVNLAHANTWSGTQTFGTINITTALELSGGGASGTILEGNGSAYASAAVAAASDIWSAGTNKVLEAGNVFNSAGAAQSLSGTTSVTPNFGAGFNFTFTATSGDNFTLQNPTNIKAGQMGCITFTQPASGSTVGITYGTEWHFAGGTAPGLTQTLGASDQLCYYAKTTTYIVGTMLANVQ